MKNTKLEVCKRYIGGSSVGCWFGSSRATPAGFAA